MSDPISDVREQIIRLDGKLDAYAAGQSARLDSIDRRLNAHDTALDDLRALGTAPKTVSGWTIASVVIGGVVGLGSLLAVLITLMRIIPDAP